MKIVFAGERFYPAKGGGERSAIALLSHLAKRHDVSAFYIHDWMHDRIGDKNVGSAPEIYNGVKLHTIMPGMESDRNIGLARLALMRRRWREFDEYIKNETAEEGKPDLVITQGDAIPQTIEVAAKHNIKTIAFIRSYNYICISSFAGVDKAERHSCLGHASIKQLMQYPIFLFLSGWYRKLIKKATVVSNSEFTKKLMKECCNVSSEVVYPFVEFENYKTKRKAGADYTDYITFVRPQPHKGLDVFLKIADSMPDRKFLVVGESSNPDELRKRRNVEYLGWTDDMKSVYAKTRLLIAPSVWHEPFGRIAVEAMVNGIPCIVSDRGGLPEAVGDAGIVVKDIYDTGSWVSAIESLDDGRLYKKLSRNAVRHAERFESERQFKKFEEVLKGME